MGNNLSGKPADQKKNQSKLHVVAYWDMLFFFTNDDSPPYVARPEASSHTGHVCYNEEEKDYLMRLQSSDGDEESSSTVYPSIEYDSLKNEPIAPSMEDEVCRGECPSL